MSKVFSFTADYDLPIYADQIIKGGSGYCITKVGDKEEYNDKADRKLPKEIEHMYPDYSLYQDLTKDTAFGFLTRGCPRGCDFCHVKKKEGRSSVKVADLSEFWKDQKKICLCDPNILACKDWEELFDQLIASKAIIDFNQGIDVRLATQEKIEYMNQMRIRRIHLAWDRPEDHLEEYFERFAKYYKRKNESGKVVYVLTNFNSTIEEDLYRINTLRSMRFDPYIMVYDKGAADETHKRMARWVNNRAIWRSCKRFEDYN